MGQCSDKISEKAEVAAHSVSVDRAKRVSSNPALTAARYHCPLRGGRRLEDDYEVSSKVLGQGLCGEVVLAYSRADNRKYALKRIKKKNVSWAKLQQLTEEVEIYLALDHPHIARLHNVYETEDCVSLLTEYCEGGELYFTLQKRGVYSDAEAAEAARQMLRAVGYLHAHNIVHRDLKLENFLYEERDEAQSEPHLKLIDFGFAKIWDPSTKMTASCGSIAYVSPDVLYRKGYTDQCDLWSLGVVLWMLLAGYPPFHGSEKSMMENIKAGRADWSHRSRWNPVSEDAIDLVRRLLIVDPQQRPRAAEALQHRWLARPATPMMSGVPLLCSLQDYAAAPKVRRALLQLLVQELPSEETRDLRADFLALDRGNSGTICLSDLKDAISTYDVLSAQDHMQKLPAGFHPAAPARGALRSDSSGVLEELLAALDMNGDGQVYFSDFLAATLRLDERHGHEDAMRAAFARLDADSSGTIDACDLACVFGDTFEGIDAEELLAQADVAGDGEIDFDTFAEVLLGGGSPAGTPTATPPLGTPCTSTPRISLDTSPDDVDAQATFGSMSGPLGSEVYWRPSPAATSMQPRMLLADLASPAKPEDIQLEEVPSPGPKLLGGRPGSLNKVASASLGSSGSLALAAAEEKDGGHGEKVFWRLPQSPLGGS